MSHYKPYPTYKDSGVDWIGQVPEHWEVVPLRHVALFKNSNVVKKDKGVGLVGYEINFNRFFYKYIPPRKLHDIDADLKQVEAEIAALLGEVTE